MLKPSIWELKDILQGESIAILGSGPTLPSSVTKLPRSIKKLNINIRPFSLCKYPFIGFSMDKIPGRWIQDNYRRNEILRISNRSQYSDYAINRNELYDASISVSMALDLVLRVMNCSEVILCGFDLYRGELPYFDSKKGDHHPQQDVKLIKHIGLWERIKKGVPDNDKIKLLGGGPLIKLFEEYKNE